MSNLIDGCNVMLTYKGSVRVSDGGYGRHEKQVVTRMAVFSSSSGYYDSKDNWIETPNGFFHVPQYWKTWTWSDGTQSLMPETFYSLGRVLPENVINLNQVSLKTL